MRSLGTELPNIDSALHKRFPDYDPVGKFLWDTFANKPEEQKFSGCPMDGLRQRSLEFSQALVSKARSLSLAAAALDSCLVRARKIGLPVGAYATTQGELPVWIVVIKQGFDVPALHLTLSHIMITAFDARTYTVVGSINCN